MRQIGLAGMSPGLNTRVCILNSTLNMRFIPTCCAASQSSDPTKFGRRTSRIFGCHEASPTCWRSSTGTRVGCSVGGSATARTRCSASIAGRTPCTTTARRKSSTAIKAHRSPAPPHGRAETGRRGHQHGWPGASLRQYLRRTTLAQRQARGRVSEGLRQYSSPSQQFDIRLIAIAAVLLLPALLRHDAQIFKCLHGRRGGGEAGF